MTNKTSAVVLAMALVFPHILSAFCQEKDGIIIQCNDVTKDPSTQVISFSRWQLTADDLQKNNITAATVTITNNTASPVCISSKSINVDHMSVDKVAAKFEIWLLLRVVLAGFGISFTCYGLIQKISPMKATTQQAYSAATWDEKRKIMREYEQENKLLYAGAEFMMVVSYLGYIAYLAPHNVQLVKALQQNILGENLITIAPGESVEKVVFCEGAVQPNFNVTVFNENSEPVVQFDVELFHFFKSR